MWWWLKLYFLVLSCSYGNAAKHSKDSVSFDSVTQRWVCTNVCVSCPVQGRDGAESLTLVLQYAIGDGEFSERGVASVRSLKSSTTAMSLSQNPLSHAQLDEIKVIVASNTELQIAHISLLSV